MEAQELSMLIGNCVRIGCLVSLLVDGAALADEAPSTAEVLGKMHHLNLQEIEKGKMAQDHGLSKDVRSFGKMLVKDHAAADKKVVKLAKGEKLDLAAHTPPRDTKTDQIHTGTAFDDAFAKEMLDDHKKDVAELTAARDGTTDAKLKQLLTDILPVLKKHQDAAQKLVEQSSKRGT
jgi:putative membrane protein